MTDQHAIETMLLEERRYPPSAEFAAQANAKPEIYDEDFEAFWEREGRERLTWFEPFAELYEWEPPYAKWYLGGKLNVCFNCVDRHVDAGKGDKVAYYWEGEPEGERREISYADLQRDVVRFANALKKLGVGKGTPVAIYMGMVPELAGGDARVHPARRAAHRRLRRLLGGLALGSHDRHGVRGADHAGRGVAARLGGASEEGRRRGDGGRAEMSCRRRTSPHRQRRRDGGRAATTGGTSWRRASPTIRSRARASRWTAKTCCS